METASKVDRPAVIYLSYDGVEEPLGQSQVLGYLTGLAAEYEITLISFEKSAELQGDLRQELAERGIEWRRLRYHRRPPVLSTTFDVLAGQRALIRAARPHAPAVVHVRSYVPALMARWARSETGGKLLFDIRGFWADERVEGGLWRPGGLLYRIAKRYERSFFGDADAIVTLTYSSVPQVRAWAGERPVPIDVIPTCVDIKRFSGRPERAGGPHVVWSGSVGTWYRFDLAPRLAAALSLAADGPHPPDRRSAPGAGRPPGLRPDGGTGRHARRAVRRGHRVVPVRVVVLQGRHGTDALRRVPGRRDAGRGDAAGGRPRGDRRGSRRGRSAAGRRRRIDRRRGRAACGHCEATPICRSAAGGSRASGSTSTPAQLGMPTSTAASSATVDG